jgi:nucleoside-diphosphate-sugar epimerase
MPLTRILIVGALGQIGTELTQYLRDIYGRDNVIASDIRPASDEISQNGPYRQLDALDGKALRSIIEEFEINQVYLMAAMLSATAEKAPMKAWNLNMNSLFHVLETAKDGLIQRVFWPSSIAVFGPTTPADNTPQKTVMEPTTVYGISKQTGERWCAYYHKNYGVDVRSLRYPGLISYSAPPGGGTTDYAIDIFHKALSEKHYNCFLSAHTELPMMYMEDAIRATHELMAAESEQIKERGAYNLAGVSFDPQTLAQAIAEEIPDFTIDYAPDFRQKIADSWPNSIDDSAARKDWGWAPRYDISAMVLAMIEGLKKQ